MTRSSKVTTENLSAEWNDFAGKPLVVIVKDSGGQRAESSRIALTAEEWETLK